MKRTSMKIWDIIIPSKMTSSKPKLYKVMGMKAYYRKYKHFYGSVIIDSKSHTVLDGYVIVYTAKEMKINDIPVTIVTKRERFTRFLKRIFRKKVN